MKRSVRSIALVACLVAAMAGCTDQNGAASSSAGTTSVSASEAAALKVKSWGPKNTPTATTFNLQPDGNSGVFAELTGPVPQTRFTASLGGKPLSAVVASGNVVTATVPKDYLAAPGSYPLELQIPAMDIRIPAGDFVVGSGPEEPAAETGPSPAH